MRQTSERLDADLARHLSFLPDTGIWAIATPTLAVWARVDDMLYTVVIDVPNNHVLTTSRKLDVDKLVVALEFGEPTHGPIRWYPTKWAFRQDGEKPYLQRIDGTYGVRHDGTHELDRNEAFARELAERAGWTGLANAPRLRAVG
jgi:hypothetical protein